MAIICQVGTNDMRLEIGVECPPFQRALMQACWKPAAERPKFEQVIAVLQAVREEGWVEEAKVRVLLMLSSLLAWFPFVCGPSYPLLCLAVLCRAARSARRILLCAVHSRRSRSRLEAAWMQYQTRGPPLSLWVAVTRATSQRPARRPRTATRRA
jgi:hypothetical protein